MSTDDTNQYLEQWEAYVRKWKRRTLGLGIALVTSIICVIPFLAGHSLHRHFKEAKYLVYLCCSLWTLFVGAGALTYNFWSYWRRLKAESQAANSRSS